MASAIKQMKLKPQMLYLYAFNTCKKGILSSGKNHVLFRLNNEKDAIEMVYASPEKKGEIITIIRNGIQFSVHPEKGFIFSYKEDSGKECSVLLRPCNDTKKYPLCLQEGVDYYDNESWINKVKTWFMEAKTIINTVKDKRIAKTVKKALPTIPSTIPSLESRLALLKRGGSKRKTRKTRKTRRHKNKRNHKRATIKRR